jgi:signal transduction histidine kinase
MEVQHKPVRLRAFMDDIYRMFLLKAQEKNLEFRVEEGDTYPPVIKLDEDKLRQILINLIGNAIKFTSKGRVIVRFGAVSGNVIRFEVIDTGSGISEVSQKKLFQPFMQGNSGFQDGTGLGLAITRKLVDLIGGSISFVSEEGSGSVFRVALPFEVRMRQKQNRKSNPPSGNWVVLLLRKRQQFWWLTTWLLTGLCFQPILKKAACFALKLHPEKKPFVLLKR